MLTRIEAVLGAAELSPVREVLRDSRFVDGRASAGARAARVKNNTELPNGAESLEALNRVVMGRLVRHPVYQAAALPLRVAAPYYVRYVAGMDYGVHVDDPVMGAEGARYRSDLSITVFLSEPAEYDGGELEIRADFGSQSIKLPAGDAIMYPSSSLHRVAPVTRGERLVAVTWVQSMIRSPEQRRILFDLSRVRDELSAADPDSAAAATVDHAYVNLVRMWSEV